MKWLSISLHRPGPPVYRVYVYTYFIVLLSVGDIALFIRCITVLIFPVRTYAVTYLSDGHVVRYARQPVD